MNTVIKSKLFENVEFNISDDGYHIQLINDTNVFKSGKAFAPSDLFKKDSHLKYILQWEADKIFYENEENRHLAFINDMKYSIKCFNYNYSRFSALEGIASLEKYSITYDKNTSMICYGFNSKQALLMFEYFCKHNNIIVNNRYYEVEQIEIKQKDFYSEYLSKNVFYIPDHDKEKIPFSELDYYNWLDVNNIKNHHTINTRKEYLDYIGFDNKIHF